MKNQDVVLKIVEVMQQSGKPLILNHIARRTRIPVQLVDYHLEKLIESGIIYSLKENGSTFYTLQPVFYDGNWLNALYAQLTPFVEDMADGDILFEQTKIPREKVVINIITVFLGRFQVEIEKTFKSFLNKA